MATTAVDCEQCQCDKIARSSNAEPFVIPKNHPQHTRYFRCICGQWYHLKNPGLELWEKITDEQHRKWSAEDLLPDPEDPE